MQKIRYLDKLVDELAKGKTMEKILWKQKKAEANAMKKGIGQRAIANFYSPGIAKHKWVMYSKNGYSGSCELS